MRSYRNGGYTREVLNATQEPHAGGGVLGVVKRGEYERRL